MVATDGRRVSTVSPGLVGADLRNVVLCFGRRS